MKVLTFLSFFITLSIWLIFCSSCGQPIPPTGGPRDSLPPLITGAVPADSSINFTGNKITLTFNEYINLERPFEEITYSPLPKKNPLAEGKFKTVIIKIKDTLEPNTTYSIDFGSSIRDINENNILRDYRYVFSTGSRIDSGVLTGRVIIAETGKTDSTLIVVLHRSADDSAVAKEKPRYAARLNNEGNFTFRYLAPGTYFIYALKDVDGSKKYDQQSELIGFLNHPVSANQQESILLYAFPETIEKPKTVTPGAGQATTAVKNKEDKRLRVATNLDAGKQDILGNLVLSFENKLIAYDTAKMIFTNETYAPLPDYTMREDSSHKKLTLTHAWKENTKYNLILQKEFAKDSAGNAFVKTDTLSFQTKKETDYGSLNIILSNLDTSMHPILLFYRDEKIDTSQILTLNRYKYRLVRPGEYEIIVLFDSNRNGKWDTGNYWKKLQPEKIVSRKQKLNIRPNWDNELEINLKDFGN